MMVVSMISWQFSTMSCTQPVSRTEIMSCCPEHTAWMPGGSRLTLIITTGAR